MMIQIGSWMIPFAITVLVFGIGQWRTASTSRGGDYAFGREIIGAFWLLIATIASLSAWLIWALVR